MRQIRLVDGTWINNFRSYDDAVAFVVDRIRENRSCIINFLYFSSFVLQRRLRPYHEALVHSDYIFLDGIGMTSYVRLVHGEKNVLNLNGTDLLPSLLAALNESGSHPSISLYGASDDVIPRAKDNLCERYSHIDFKYFKSGYEELDFHKLEPGTLLLVGLGTPKQEIFVHQHADFFQKNNIKAITVGGFFDFVGGNAERAPDAIRRLGLEWAHRMIQHPNRHLSKNLRNLLFINVLLRDYFLSRRKHQPASGYNFREKTRSSCQKSLPQKQSTNQTINKPTGPDHNRPSK